MNEKLYTLAAVLVMAALIGAVLIGQNSSNKNQAINVSKNSTVNQTVVSGGSGSIITPPAPEAPSINMTNLSSGGLHIGSDTAPVIMVEFGDYQCPFCRSFWQNEYPSLKSDYIDTGKVEFVYLDFPLNIHPMAEISAEADACAQDQGKGWEMQDKIFAGQAALGVNVVPYTDSDIKAWAESIGLNTTAFNSCLDSGKYTNKILQDISNGQGLGISATPAFIIGKRDSSNIVPINGALPYGTFNATIAQLLK